MQFVFESASRQKSPVPSISIDDRLTLSRLRVNYLVSVLPFTILKEGCWITWYDICVLVEISNVRNNFPCILTFWDQSKAIQLLTMEQMIIMHKSQKSIFRPIFIYFNRLNLAFWQHLFQSKNFWQFWRSLVEPNDFQTILLHRLQFLIGQAPKAVCSRNNNVNLTIVKNDDLRVSHAI